MDKMFANRPIPPAGLTAVLSGFLVMCGLVVTAASSEAPERSIEVLSGTYGSNCGLPQGNVSRDLMSRCDGNQTCSYELADRSRLAQVQRCRPDFVAEWRCGDAEFHTAALASGAKPGDTLVLSCARSTGAGK